MTEIFSMLAIACAFSLLGLSVYLSTQILKVIDFTCDASVSIGGCSYAAAVIYGMNPIIAILIAAIFGGSAGYITASLTSNLKLKTEVSSILTFTMMQIFLQRMYTFGNFSINNQISTSMVTYSGVAIFGIVGGCVLLLTFLIYKIVSSEYGLAMKVYSDGDLVSGSLGINRINMLSIGLGISNILAAVSGAFVVQISRSFSPNMGIGSFVFGLGSILLALKFSSGVNLRRSVCVCTISALIYKMVIMVLSHCMGSTTFGPLSEYEQIITGVVFVLLTALTFSGRSIRKSILHM